MVLRSLLVASALAFALAACSRGGDEAEETTVTEAPEMMAPVAEEAPVDESGVAEVDDATPESEAAKDEEPVAAVKPVSAPAPAPTPEKIAEATPPASYNRCAVCHTANKGGEDKLGPNLYGTYGSAAAQGGFSYSSALKDSGLTWDEATLHSWLENPRALVPGNRMSFPGIKDAAKRQEIIDYLKQQR